MTAYRSNSRTRVDFSNDNFTKRDFAILDRLVRDAKSIAFREHLMKTWGNWSYQVHLDRVEDVLIDFGYGNKTVFGYARRIAAAFHDLMEDCGWTYNDIKEFVATSIGSVEMGELVADICFAVTDEKGRNRKERKPDKLYDEMKVNMSYIVVKLADRVVNVEKAGKLDMYKKEYRDFRAKLYVSGQCDELWEYLDELHEFTA